MKRVLKRSLSLLLAITIIFSSAYIGIGEVDFDSLFTVRAEAAEDVSTSVIEENKADNFDFILYQAGYYATPEIRNVILNSMNKTTLSAGLVEDMKGNAAFNITYGAWEAATYIANPGELVGDVLFRETYYESIILRLINMSFESDTAIDWINQKSIKQSINIGKALTNYAEQNYYNFLRDNMQNISELNEVQKECLTNWAKEHVKSQNYSIIGDDLKFVSTVLSTADDIESFTESLAVYLQIANVADSTIEYLKIIKDNSEDENLIKALDNVILMSEDTFKSLLTKATVDGLLALGKTSIKNLMAKQWKNLLIKLLTDGVLSNGAAIINSTLIGINLGKTISNMAFSVDAKLDVFESMKCLVIFEKALKQSFETTINNYDGTTDSAVLLLEGVELVYSTLILDASLFLEMALISEKDWLTDSTEETELVKSVANQQIETYQTEYDEISFSNKSCGDSLNWIILEDGSLLIYGIGAMTQYVWETDFWRRESEKIKKIYISSKVTEIGYYAFEHCNNLTSVIIPKSVKKISKRAFNNCTSLESVHITDIGSWCEINFEGYESNPLYWAMNLYLNGELVTDVIVPDGVTRIGSYAFYKYNILKSIFIPDSVTTIGTYAFYSCKNLPSINIPDSVTTIGTFAFYDCKNLNSVYINNLIAWCNINFKNYLSNPLYYADNLYINGELVTNVVVPDGITRIPTYGFSSPNITSVKIPDSITSIGEDAFSDCENLESLYIYNIGAWCEIDFENDTSNPLRYAKSLYLDDELVTDIVIPYGVEKIPIYGFSCQNIISVTIPDGVSSIDNSAFRSCTNLKYVKIGKNVTNIEDYAFFNCTNLVSVTMLDGVKNIGGRAFSYCTSLASIIIPNGVTNIDYEAFYGCSNLASIILPDSLREISRYVFEETKFYKDSSNWNNGVLYIGNHLIKVNNTVSGSFQIRNNTITIATQAFIHCANITSINIPESLKIIGESAFYSCSRLKSINIPKSVTKIGVRAFAFCKQLLNVKIPNSVISIGESAFLDCISLTSIAIPDSVTSIGVYVFSGFNGTIYCVENSVAHRYAVNYNIDYVFVNIFETPESSIDYENLIINTDIEGCDNIAEILYIANSSNAVVKASCKTGSIEFLGTETIVSVYEGDTHIGDYTLVVNGDTNGDSICDVLDCFDVERTANGNSELSGTYAEAGDTNGDGVIDITDYQSIVNKAVS